MLRIKELTKTLKREIWTESIEQSKKIAIVKLLRKLTWF